MQYDAFTSRDIILGKVDKRKRVEGFNQPILPKGTKIHVLEGKAEKIYRNALIFKDVKYVEMSVYTDSRYRDRIHINIHPDGSVDSLTPYGKEIFESLIKDTSLEAQIKYDYPYASPMDILKELIERMDISIEKVLKVAKEVDTNEREMEGISELVKEVNKG